jgi:hypothetical protein
MLHFTQPSALRRVKVPSTANYNRQLSIVVPCGTLPHLTVTSISELNISLHTFLKFPTYLLTRHHILQNLCVIRFHPAFNIILKLKFSLYRPGVAQRVGRGIVLLFHDRGTRRG